MPTDPMAIVKQMCEAIKNWPNVYRATERTKIAD